MATAAALDTVWVGFMDVVPVIGTVKEAVEWILAVYENNKEMVKEKEQQIIGFLKPQIEMEKLEEGIEELSLPETTKASEKEGPGKPEMSRASAFAGLQNIREIKEKSLLEYVRTCFECKSGKRKMGKKKEIEMREKIRKDVQEKLKLLKLDKGLTNALENEVKRSKIGEHIFNNSILDFHSKVLENFKDRYRINSQTWQEQVIKNKLDGHTLSPEEKGEKERNIKKEITKEMQVIIEDTEFYVNANAVLYGCYSQELGNAFQNVLDCVCSELVSKEKKETVVCIIDLMNKYELYVDHLAKQKWIDGNGERIDRFRHVKDKVVKMYCEKRGYSWCINILDKLRLWFETPKEFT